MNSRKISGALFIAALASTALISPLAAQEQKPAQATTQADKSNLPAIVVTTVSERDLRDSVVASGTIRAVEEVYVQPLVDGLSIKSLKVDVGDKVNAGQVVAELNSDSLLLQKSQLQANKAKAEAGLAQYRAQVIEAQANADDAIRQRDRTQNLSRSGTASTAQVEQTAAAAEAAIARLNAAKQSISVGEADIKVVQAQIDDINLKLERTDVKAPVAGIISKKDAKVGAIASGSGTPLFTMIRDGDVELVADVPESEIGRLKAGMTAKVTVAGTTQALDGKIRLISPVVDQTTRLGAVHIIVNDESAAKVGMYANAEITIKETRGLALPQSAVTTDRKGSFARLVQGNVVKQVKLDIGIQEAGFVQILGGLKVGDQVVAKAGAFVRDGDHIKPITSANAASN
ncbi:efflux RND transporter periplasmic adaptor subunit [Rhizobium sp. FKY42]|uniref:efflux RND transporter periplasmic adaptor subunit n=1 Tax=Rhizobium sp. FKY42 TaxID=2562310 RepID=UPI0010C15184|nr:efflux RND transporter periplasmic adaptor subunit [Rhizobium sp. FKY42]